jgi:hypothetical protein
MYLFLLAFGAFLSVAGVVLAASGLSIHDHTFDTSLVTPGIVGVVGGLLLIGLGFALRVLQRIEHALETRPVMPRVVRAGVAPEPVAPAAAPLESSSDPGRVPFPMKITRPPQPAAPQAPAPFSEKHAEEVPQKFPSIARAAPAPAAPATPELPPRQPMHAADDHGMETASDESGGAFFPRPFKGRNGAAPAPRVSPRLDASARAPLTPQRPAGPAFDAFWPKGPRRGAAQAKPVPAPEMPVVATEPVAQQPTAEERVAQERVAQERVAQERVAQEQVAQQRIQEPIAQEPVAGPVAQQPVARHPDVQEQPVATSPAVAPDVTPEDAPVPISILKSGIVDGMAYTLYSDGSIEAQLPQGRLRFGSISELRAHIEQDTQS